MDGISKLIIDVSYHNGVINWEKVKASGCAGAILRCGYGDNIASQDDKQWIRNLAECERLGIPVGVYLYSYATCDRQAQSELEHILRLIKGIHFSYLFSSMLKSRVHRGTLLAAVKLSARDLKRMDILLESTLR